MSTEALIARLEGLGDAARIVAKVARTDTARSHARGLAAGYYAAAQLLRDNAPAPSLPADHTTTSEENRP